MDRRRRHIVKLLAGGALVCPFMAAGSTGAAVGVFHRAAYYEDMGDKRVRCLLCPRKCRVADMERGTCGVRENRGGVYYTLVHSNPCSLHNDPIEKKPLFHYRPGTKSFSLATATSSSSCLR